MIGGLDALALVVGTIFGILIGASSVLYFSTRCYCYPESKDES